MKALAELSTECHQSIKVNLPPVDELILKISWSVYSKWNYFKIYDCSTIAISLHWSWITSFIPGGTTEMEIRNISGPEITRTEFTPVSAESTGIASILPWKAIVTRQRLFH